MRFAALLALLCLVLAPAPPGRKLVAFLERLGVGEYVELLAEDDVVDLATLRLLSMEQLRELGIRSMGHRARMVEAASRLTEEEMAEDEVVEEAEAAPEAAPKLHQRPRKTHMRKVKVVIERRARRLIMRIEGDVKSM